MAARRYFSGESIEQAVLEAAGHFGVSPDELAYKELEKRHGFLRQRRNVVIAVDPEAPRRETRAPATPRPAVAAPAESRPTSPEPPAPAPEPPAAEPPAATEPEPPAAEPPAATEPEPSSAAPPAPPAEAPREPSRAAAPAQSVPEPSRAEPVVPDAAAVERAEEAIDLLLELADLDVQPRGRVVGSTIWVEISGSEEERALDDGAALLELLEYLGSRLLRGDEDVPAVRVDCRGQRRRRLEAVEAEAKRLAAEVLRTGEPAWTELLPPSDRREVHLSIRRFDGLDTESEGRGRDKRVRIFPS